MSCASEPCGTSPANVMLWACSSTARMVRTTCRSAAPGMTFAGDVPQGSLAQLMRASFDRLVDGAYDATVAAGAALTTDEPTLAVAVSCVCLLYTSTSPR